VRCPRFRRGFSRAPPPLTVRTHRAFIPNS
jgi:hypothetical protein